LVPRGTFLDVDIFFQHFIDLKEYSLLVHCLAIFICLKACSG